MRTKEQRLHDRTLAADRRSKRAFEAAQDAQRKYHSLRRAAEAAFAAYHEECVRVDMASDLPRVTLVDPEDGSTSTAFVVERGSEALVVRDPGARLDHQVRTLVRRGNRFVGWHGHYTKEETP